MKVSYKTSMVKHFESNFSKQEIEQIKIITVSLLYSMLPLHHEVEKFEKYAEKTPNFEKLNQDAQEALIDMTYNMGVGWMWPTLRKQFEEMDLQGAAKTIRNSRYATQVKDRAQKNADAISNGLKNLPPTNIPSNTIGSNIDTSSKENKQLNESLQNTSTGTNTINQTNVNVSQSPQQTSQRQSVDDRSAYERKSRIK